MSKKAPKNEALFTSDRQDWETPRELFETIDGVILPPYEWGDAFFNLDAAASERNALCSKFYTVKDNGLVQPWEEWTWCNPPYGSATDLWVKKAADEYARGVSSALLVAARTETKRFHMAVDLGASVLFLKGRIKFELDGIPGKAGAPFPSCVLFFGKVKEEACRRIGAFMPSKISR